MVASAELNLQFWTETCGPGLETEMVRLLKENAMHYHSKLFGTALKWS